MPFDFSVFSISLVKKQGGALPTVLQVHFIAQLHTTKHFLDSQIENCDWVNLKLETDCPKKINGFVHFSYGIWEGHCKT